jgi:hypothetical protein
VPYETHREGDSDRGSDRGQQIIVATDSKSDSSSDENAGNNIAVSNIAKNVKILNSEHSKGKHPSRQCGVCTVHKNSMSTFASSV